MVEQKSSANSGLSDSFSGALISPVLKAKTLNKPKTVLNTCRFIEIFAVIITCIVFIYQSGILVKQLRESKLSRELQGANFLREHYQTINKMLVEHEEVRTVFDLSLGEVMAYMLLAEYDSMYQMFNDQTIEAKKWQDTVEPFIYRQMTADNSKLPIKLTWRNDPGARTEGFLQYVEACVYPDLYDPPSTGISVDMAEPPVAEGADTQVAPRSRFTLEARQAFRTKACPRLVPRPVSELSFLFSGP